MHSNYLKKYFLDYSVILSLTLNLNVGHELSNLQTLFSFLLLLFPTLTRAPNAQLDWSIIFIKTCCKERSPVVFWLSSMLVSTVYSDSVKSILIGLHLLSICSTVISPPK